MAEPLLFVTVDTEEDDWGAYHTRNPAVSNIRRLLEFQELCDNYGVLPTYLCNWPVVADDSSRHILRELHDTGRCEIGTHIHPWNTPPIEQGPAGSSSMLSNLPTETLRAKLLQVHHLIEERLEVRPKTFRAGRWGFDARVAQVLLDLGYDVDSSVSPYVDWRSESGPDYRSAPVAAYRFHPERPLAPADDGGLVEIPATIGFLSGNPDLSMRLREWGMRPLPRRLRMVGILDRLGLATRRWLSPELSTGPEMIGLAQRLRSSGAAFLNLTFHSSSLYPGATPFTRSTEEVREFLGRIEAFFSFAKGAGVRSAKLKDGPQLLGL